MTTPQADSAGSYYTYQEGLVKDFSLPSNHILFFKELKNGTIWIGTEKGLVCLQRDAKGIYKNVTDNSFPTNVAYTCITNRADELPYFGTSDGQLLYIEPDGTIALRKISQSAIHTLKFSKDATRLYATTAGGELLAIDVTGHVPAFATKYLMNDKKNPLFAVYEDKCGYLWIEPQREGGIRINPVTSKLKTYSQPNNAKYN